MWKRRTQLPGPGDPPPLAGNPAKSRHPTSDAPVKADFECNNFTIGGGVAIFHVATARVVLCYHSRDEFWFLPKGRRDVHETTEQGAEREGYEESGYRNRILPLSIRHRQPQPRIPVDPLLSEYATEPIWMQLTPQTRTTQYILYWYICETLPPDLEKQLDVQEAAAETAVFGAPYQYPPKFPLELSFKHRLSMETNEYEPPRHEGTGADEEEALYESKLLPIEEAKQKVKGSIQEHVISKGWEAILSRLAKEGITLRDN